MTEFLALSGLVGWIILGTILFISTCMFSKKNYFGLYILGVVCAVVYYKLIPRMPWTMWLLLFAMYLGIGAGWSIFKWQRHVLKQVARYKNNIVNANISQQNSYYRDLQYATRPSNNKSQIINNITWWPFSILDFLFSDLITYIFDSLINVYSYVTNRAMSGVSKPPDVN